MIKRRSLLLLGIIAVAVFGLATALAGLLIHFNLAYGTYTYDPKTQAPPTILVDGRPETSVLTYLNNQIQQTGTYPAGAPSKVALLEPVAVRIGSIYTDSQMPLEVQVAIHYADGSLHDERFQFTSGGCLGAELGNLAVSYQGRLRPLERCWQAAPGITNCD